MTLGIEGLGEQRPVVVPFHAVPCIAPRRDRRDESGGGTGVLR